MGFFLFILVNAVLFIRPAEVFPALLGLPIYNAVMIACLVGCFGKVLGQFTGPNLIGRPITCCVLGIMAAIPISLIGASTSGPPARGWMPSTRSLLYYLFLVANLDSAARLRSFLRWLVLLIAVVTALAVLQYYDMIHLRGIQRGRGLRDRPSDRRGVCRPADVRDGDLQRPERLLPADDDRDHDLPVRGRRVRWGRFGCSGSPRWASSSTP